MAEKFKLDLPDGRRVTTDSAAAAIRLKYGSGAVEALRSAKVDKAVEEAKAESVAPESSAAKGASTAKVQ
jgi:hypothetical protein